MSIMNNHITICPIVWGNSWHYTNMLQVRNAHASAHNFTCTIHFENVCWSLLAYSHSIPPKLGCDTQHSWMMLNSLNFILIITGDMWNMFWKLPSWHDECCCMWSSFLQYMLERFVNLGLNICLYMLNSCSREMKFTSYHTAFAWCNSSQSDLNVRFISFVP